MNGRGQTVNIHFAAPDHQRGQSYDLLFSTPWKNVLRIFHAMEKFFPDFPRHGKIVSTLWKTAAILHSSFLILSLSFLAGCSEPPPAAPQLPAGQDAAATATLSTNRIRIGDPVRLTVEVLHRDGTLVEFPSVARGKDIIVRDSDTVQTDLPGDLCKTEQMLRLTSMSVTNHVIGDGEQLTIATPQGLHWTLPYPFAALEVESSLAPGETDPRPAKGGLARWPAPPSRWIWIALAALALLAAAVAALHRVLTAPRTILHMPPPVPPHQAALDAIEALRAKGWIEALNIEPFYVELSAIVRRYLEARFGLRAPERTTEEFIRDALSSKKLSDAHRDLVGGFLEQSDLVKFARHAPGPGDMRNALDSAARLVRETMPSPDPRPPAAPAPDPRPPAAPAPDPHPLATSASDPRPLAGRVNQVGESRPEAHATPSSPMAQGHGGHQDPLSSSDIRTGGGA